MDTLEERVLEFVSRECKVKRRKISLASRVSQDFGIDGHDAVEFFERFAREFDVELLPLQEKWPDYFAPEGGPGWPFIVVCVVSYLIGAIIQHFVGWPPALLSALLLVVLWIWPLKTWPFPRGNFGEITVRDLLNSATTHYWGGLKPAAPVVRAPRFGQLS